MDKPPIEVVPSVDVTGKERPAPPAVGHPSGMNRAQRRAAFKRHKRAATARRQSSP